MAGELPAHARASLAIASIEGLTTAESSVLTAAIRWVNFTTGELWPSVSEWTRTARVSARGFHKIIKRLCVRGLVVVVKPTKGGRGCTTVYRIPALAVNNTAPEYGVSAEETPHSAPNNPALGDTKPRTGDHNPALGTRNPAQLVRTNIQEQPLEHPRNRHCAAAVAEGMSWAWALFEGAWGDKIPAAYSKPVLILCRSVEADPWNAGGVPDSPARRRELFAKAIEIAKAEKGGNLAEFNTPATAARFIGAVCEKSRRTGRVPGINAVGDGIVSSEDAVAQYRAEQARKKREVQRDPDGSRVGR